MPENEHRPTVIEESNGYSVICSCGWRDGRTFNEAMSAEMAWAMNHVLPAGEE